MRAALRTYECVVNRLGNLAKYVLNIQNGGGMPKHKIINGLLLWELARNGRPSVTVLSGCEIQLGECPPGYPNSCFRIYYGYDDFSSATCRNPAARARSAATGRVAFVD